MKNILLTYHMRSHRETAETCICVPMLDDTAEDLLRNPVRFLTTLSPQAGYRLHSLLSDLSALQGYTFDGLVAAEEVEDGA